MIILQSRADIAILVHAFYKKVRKDELLGPIFNAHLSDQEWPEHLDKLTDFWQTNLTSERTYRGSPSKKHIAVDQAMQHSMSPEHFGQWINLWIATIDELFEGPLAEKAKYLARKMGTGQYLSVWQNRQKNNNT